MTREFILLALKAWTTPDFSLDNLPRAGRMDLVCRVVANCLYFSHHIRTDTAVHVVMNGPRNPPIIVSFYGDKIEGMDFDERSVGAYFLEALRVGAGLKIGERSNVKSGLVVKKSSFEALLSTIADDNKTQMVYLDMKGEDIRSFKFRDNFCVIFGDFKGMPAKADRFVKRLIKEGRARAIKLGPATLFASHCPVIVHNEVDRRIAGWV